MTDLMLSAFFATRPRAEGAAALLRERGIGDHQLNIIDHPQGMGEHFRLEPASVSAGRVAAGGVIGTLLGGLLGLGWALLAGLSPALAVASPLLIPLAGSGLGSIIGLTVGFVLRPRHGGALVRERVRAEGVRLDVETSSPLELEGVAHALEESPGITALEIPGGGVPEVRP